MLVGYVVKLTAIVALYLYMYLENKRRDREAVESLDSDSDAVENGMLVSFLLEDWDNGELTWIL